MQRVADSRSSIQDEMRQKAHELLDSSSVSAVLGWKQGISSYDVTPWLLQTSDDIENMVYNSFCASNLSKYLVEITKQEKILVFLKPCDTYSLNQLLVENRVSRDNLHIVGIGCDGMVDIDKLRARDIKGILEIETNGDNLIIKTMYGNKTCPRADVLYEKCLSCKGKEHKIYDEIISADFSQDTAVGDKLSKIVELESMSSDERFAFWRGQLSKCIRCNACRNACPACTCNQCVFDNPKSGVSAKVNATEFEENMFHIIRAFHVAGRCSDCGECTRVCPQGVPLHLLNRKFVKDINAFYGDFQAGETSEVRSPLLNFDFQDAEPNVISNKGGGN